MKYLKKIRYFIRVRRPNLIGHHTNNSCTVLCIRSTVFIYLALSIYIALITLPYSNIYQRV